MTCLKTDIRSYKFHVSPKNDQVPEVFLTTAAYRRVSLYASGVSVTIPAVDPCEISAKGKIQNTFFMLIKYVFCKWKLEIIYFDQLRLRITFIDAYCSIFRSVPEQ